MAWSIGQSVYQPMKFSDDSSGKQTIQQRIRRKLDLSPPSPPPSTRAASLTHPQALCWLVGRAPGLDVKNLFPIHRTKSAHPRLAGKVVQGQLIQLAQVGVLQPGRHRSVPQADPCAAAQPRVNPPPHTGAPRDAGSSGAGTRHTSGAAARQQDAPS